MAQSEETVSVCNLTFAADQLSVRAALADIRNSLEHALPDEALLGRVECALAELFNNIVKHAYAGDPSGTLRCTVVKSVHGVVVNVVDYGEAMPGRTLPDGNLPNLDVEFSELPEGGFGWFIIKSQSDGLSYERLGVENCTQLIFESRRNA